MSIATMDNRGRITVPQDIRKFLGLREGMRLTWHSKANHTFIVGVLASDVEAFEGLEPLYHGIAELSPKARLELVARGVTMNEFDRVARDMGVRWEQLANWIDLAHPATGGVAFLRTLPNRPARRLVRLAYLIGQVESALAESVHAGSVSAPALVARWMAGSTPLRRARTSGNVLSIAKDPKKLRSIVEEYAAAPSAKR